LAGIFTGSIRAKAPEKFGRFGEWAYPGTATNFKFGTYIHRVHTNKSPLKIWEKREHGPIQGLP